MESLLADSGFPDVTALWLPDDRARTREALDQLLADPPDLVMASGGVSVGEEDHLRAVLEERGELDFWRLAIKPGKPFTFGRLGDAGVPFFGLPGNPSAVLVCYLMLVLPYLRRCLGSSRCCRRPSGCRRSSPSNPARARNTCACGGCPATAPWCWKSTPTRAPACSARRCGRTGWRWRRWITARPPVSPWIITASPICWPDAATTTRTFRHE